MTKNFAHIKAPGFWHWPRETCSNAWVGAVGPNLPFNTQKMIEKHEVTRFDDNPHVILFPGFVENGRWMEKIRVGLEDLGAKVEHIGLGFNWGPDIKNYLDQASIEVAYQSSKAGRKLHLIGHSAGGVYIRHIAQTHPEAVASTISIAAPFAAIRERHTTVLAKPMFALNRRHPILTDFDIAAGRPIEGVPALSIISNNDGVVSPDTCELAKHDGHNNVWLNTGHYSALRNKKVFTEVVRAIRDFTPN